MHSVWILVKEQLREPLTLAWNVAMPMLVFLWLNYKVIFSDAPVEGAELHPYIAYAVVSIALYSFGVVLIGRREKGFFSSVTLNRKAFLHYIWFQILASYLVLLLSIGAMLMVYSIGVQGLEIQTILRIWGGASIAYFCLAILFSSLLGLPLSLNSAYSLSSFIIIGSIAIFFMSIHFDRAPYESLFVINPVNFASVWIEGVGAEILMGMLAASLFLGLGLFVSKRSYG